jgi:hypothetical protein
MRVHTSNTRRCPAATWLSYSPSSREPWGISRERPVAVSYTGSVTFANTFPGKSELMPVISAAEMIVPAMTW